MNPFRRFLGYLKPYRWWILQAILLMFMISGLGLVMPMIMRILIDDVLPSTPAEVRQLSLDRALFAHALRNLGLLVAGIMGLRILSGGISFLLNYRIIQLSQRVIFDIRHQLHRHLQRLSMAYYESHQTGRIMARVMYDVDAIQALTTGNLITIVTDTVTLIAVIVLILWMNWKLALLALLVFPLYVLNFLGWRKRIRRTSHRIREKYSRISGSLHEKIAGAKVVKSFTRERSETREFLHDLRENLGLVVMQGQLSTALSIISDLITGLGTATVFLVGGYYVLQGHMTIGALIQFNAYLGQLYGPVVRMVQINDVIQRAMVALERVFEVLDTMPDVQDAPDAIRLDRVEGRIVFENVSFGYDPNELVLQNINLEVEPGEMIALVGPSGSGKTTFANLIARFYDPTYGRITLDGVDLRKIRLTSLRQQIGIVLQETFLFTGTIRDNIRYGRPDATEEEIIRAAQAANAHEFIMNLPDDYDTEIGERGLKLSGGQRQRIAIARVILRDPRILILDEATSSLDSTSEALIQSALDNLMRGRTSFVIAHRLSTIMKANRILVLEHGIVVDSGSHRELIERGGLYARLYEMQFKKDEAA
jgi:subfamily B ATP-binding cassette protein MsbA